MSSEPTASSIASALQAENVYVANPGLSDDIGITTALKMMKGREGSVILLERVYKIRKPIILAPGQSLISLGTSTVLQYVGDPMAGPVITLNGGGTLRNLKVLGSGSGIGIKLASGTSCFTVRDVTVQGFRNGVELNNCYTQIWSGCRFEGNDVGVHFAGQWVMNSYFTEGHIAGNRIGVLIEGAAHMGHEFKTCIEGNREAGMMVIGGLKNAEIHRCYFELNGGGDIILDDDSIEQVEIHSNLFVSAGQPPEKQSQVGVKVQAGQHVSIHDNHFSIANPLEISAVARDTLLGRNRFGLNFQPTLDKVVNARFIEGSSTPPFGWFRPAVYSSVSSGTLSQ